MIQQIQLAPNPPLERDAVDMLTACHQRIRNFTAIAARLAEAGGSSVPEIANAAEAVHRYYSIALPLHEADENESVYPRLRRRLADAGERASLEAMVEQHGPLNHVIATLLPIWDLLRTNPGDLPAHVSQLPASSARLQQLWNQHLALEEEIVFPLIRSRLTPDDLLAIHSEMKRRRGVADN